MELPNTLEVTGHTVDISGMSSEMRTYYANLTTQLTTRYRDTGQGRQVFFLAGPGGSGKSVVAALLRHLITHRTNIPFVACGIDAFHYTNQELEARDLLKVKGRFDTYDIDTLQSTLERFKEGENVAIPQYSRELHEPICGETVTEPNTLWLLEGGWLLYDSPEWERIRAYSSFSMFLNTDTDSLRENVIARHVCGGRTLADATAFYEASDSENTKLICSKSAATDLEVRYWESIY